MNQAAHTLSLTIHDLKETVPGCRVIFGRATHGFDKACKRGQRRTKFMAGIGKEVCPRFFGAAKLRQLVQSDQNKVLTEQCELLEFYAEELIRCARNLDL